ncbi:hypothetical protein JAAARDRAFT_41240 [Jaapia argillacea MUCL 33604]|uniref:N-acetyltransferase domain-containing protein n=1 Tax=Jaapia argillacea MUCL 33604 TaxID=933084 RepID=A0A067PK59_9AGAM|nr:hypothetical protein JAAARDRAFT_41240 [Jaapia argillacea MUCL 33604]
MLLNQETVLIGEKVVLVPYREEHVAKYHQWMSSAELRELTASEPLTLEEEYEMQKKWREDEDKLTFIVLARATPTDLVDLTPSSLSTLPMIGDVNLFLKGSPHAEDGGEDPDFEAEVEIMIAEPEYRRKGHALSALGLLLSYVTSPFPPPESTSNPLHLDSPAKLAPIPFPLLPKHLVSRVAETNTPSIRLFEKVGFDVVKRVAVFGEVEMRCVRREMVIWETGERRVINWQPL